MSLNTVVLSALIVSATGGRIEAVESYERRAARFQANDVNADGAATQEEARAHGRRSRHDGPKN